MSSIESLEVINKFRSFHLPLIVNLHKAEVEIQRRYGVDPVGLKVLAGIELYCLTSDIGYLSRGELESVIGWKGTNQGFSRLLRKLKEKDLIQVRRSNKFISPLQIEVTVKGRLVQRSFSEIMTVLARELYLRQKVYNRDLKEFKKAQKPVKVLPVKGPVGRPESKILCQECLEGFSRSELTTINSSFYCGDCASERGEGGE
jgi:DNA-binding MarR family transcriptional regulator